MDISIYSHDFLISFINLHLIKLSFFLFKRHIQRVSNEFKVFKNSATFENVLQKSKLLCQRMINEHIIFEVGLDLLDNSDFKPWIYFGTIVEKVLSIFLQLIFWEYAFLFVNN